MQRLEVSGAVRQIVDTGLLKVNTKNQLNPLAVCKRNSEIVTGGHFITDRSTGVSTIRSRFGHTISYRNIGSGYQTATRPRAMLVSGYHTENLIQKIIQGFTKLVTPLTATIYHHPPLPPTPPQH